MHRGHLVADRFELDRLAGSGGMGAVWRALDRRSGKPVALKLIFNQNKEHVVRFQREARLLSELEHPAVARYVDHGVTPDGQYYLAMEWLDGEDLGARLARGPLGVESSVALIGRVAEALAVVHARGIVHRDLKPTNVFLPGGEIGSVKLIDFGIARQADATYELTLTGAIGTPAYMAPERVRGDVDVDVRADLYSIGCLLFECLTGRAPFTAAHPLAVLAKVLFEAAPRPSTVSPGIPSVLDRLVVRLLAKNPADRPADAWAVVTELRSFASLDSGVPSGVGSAPSLTKSERRLVSVVLAAEMSAGKRGPPSVSARNATMRSGDAGTMDALGRPKLPAATVPLAALRQAAEPYGACIEVLTDGSVAAIIAGAGSHIDLASNAARCALAIHALLPGSWVALATGWDVIDGTQAVGQVIDRAGALLEKRAGGAVSAPSAVHPVLIDEMTAALLGDRFDVSSDSLGPTLAGACEPLDGGRRLLGKPTTCVGRDRELRALEDVLDECVSEPVARVVLVTGGPGVGKSRLRYELMRRVQARSEPVEIWLARGDPMRAGTPLGLIGQLVRRAARLLDGEPIDVRRQKLGARVARRVAASARLRVMEFLGEMIGTPYPDVESVQLRAARQDPQLMDEQMRRAWIDLLRAECRVQPVLLVLEDLHWSDKATIDFIDTALRLLHDQPLMVLALGRSSVREVFPDLWGEREATEIRLGELSRRACEKLVREVLGDELSAEAIARLVERSAGNAFFLEELVRAVAEKRTGDVPETVLAMMQARVAALEPEVRRVLRAGAVFGEVFWLSALEALLGGGGEVPQLASSLAVLERRELILQRSEAMIPGETEYVFRHALVREAAYEMLTDSDRALGHWLAAEWLERVGDGDPVVLGLVDQHLERAATEAAKMGDGHRAAGYFARAALMRVRIGHFDGAIRAMTQAFDLVDVSRCDPAELTHWVSVLAKSVSHSRRAPALPAVAERALARIDADGALELRVKYRIEMARAFGASNLFRRSYDLLDQVFEMASAHPELRREALMVDLEVSCLQGQFARARRAAADLSALGPIDEPRVLLSVAMARCTQGDREGALEALARSEVFTDAKDRVAEAVRAKLRIMIEMYAGDFRAAIQACERALELDRTLGLRFDSVVNLHNLAFAWCRLDDRERARALFLESLEQAEAGGYDRVAASNLMYLAYLDGLQGAPDARERLRALIEQAEAQGYLHDVLQGRWAAAMLLEDQRTDPLAKREFQELLELAVRLGDPMFEKDAREWLDAPKP